MFRIQSIYRTYSDQYRLNLKLALPVVLSQLGQVFVQFADNAMVGRLGADPLAAVSFAGSVFFILFVFGMGLTMGLTPLIGAAYARGEYRRSGVLLQNAIVQYSLASLVIVGLMFALIPFMDKMGQPEHIIDMAVGYYKYIALSVIPFMIFASFKQFLEGIGNTKTVMWVVIATNLLNIGLNYLYIYGVWGFPEMGAAGAGLATLISRIVGAIVIAIYFLSKSQLRRYMSFFSRFNLKIRYQLELLKVGSPIALQTSLEVSAFALTSIMMGWISAAALAANQIAQSMASATFMVVVGISSAATIRVSHQFGNGRLRGLRLSANASYHLGLAWNFFTAIALIALRKVIPLIFTSDPEVVEIASHLMIFAAVFQISDGVQNISLGILRGMQDVRITMWVAFVSYLVINLPMGYLCAFVWNMGPGGLWIGYIFGLTVAATLLNVRYRRTYRQLCAGLR